MLMKLISSPAEFVKTVCFGGVHESKHILPLTRFRAQLVDS